MPQRVRSLRILLWVQVGAMAAGALIAVLAYFVRGSEHLRVGGYAAFRSSPAVTLVLGAAIVAVLLWFIRRLPRRPDGLGRLIRRVEIVLILDAVVSFLTGLFNVWLVVGLLAAVAAWLFVRDEGYTDYLA
jgi:hypothetical protein